jgi:hypothetical protein
VYRQVFLLVSNGSRRLSLLGLLLRMRRRGSLRALTLVVMGRLVFCGPPNVWPVFSGDDVHFRSFQPLPASQTDLVALQT